MRQMKQSDVEPDGFYAAVGHPRSDVCQIGRQCL